MSATPLIEVEELVLKAFPEAAPFDFSLAAGEHWLILGDTGAGKSSLVKTLIGVLSPRHGRVRLFGDDLDTLPPQRLLEVRRRIGVVNATDGLIPAWSGFDNLSLPLRLGSLAEDSAVEEVVNAWCRRYGIREDWLAASCSTLGRDLRLTLALARALIKSPELLVLDGVPIDLAISYAPAQGLAMLRDFVARGGSLLVLVRPGFADRLPGAAIEARFQTLELGGGRLQSAPAGQPPADKPTHDPSSHEIG
jgi:ABC-type methionine transport system ATPase subunit